MLSLQKCREILGKSSDNMTDQQLQEMLDALQTLCHKVLDQYFAEVNEKQERELAAEVGQAQSPSLPAKRRNKKNPGVHF